MKVTWYGTATVEIEENGTRILFDPFIRMNRKLKTPIEDFLGADAILVTHGHIDHIYHIPQIMQRDFKVPVYCTKTPKNTLIKRHANASRIHEIKPFDEFDIGCFHIKVYPSSHVKYDGKYVLSVFGKCALEFPKLFWLEANNLLMPEAEETVTYEVEANGKRVVLMGSFGTKVGVQYPTEPDLFVYPVGGCNQLAERSRLFLDNTRPKSIMLTHHDDAFPPLTRRIDAEGIAYRLMERYPDTKCVVPKERKAIEV